jgi:hypothetical protein
MNATNFEKSPIVPDNAPQHCPQTDKPLSPYPVKADISWLHKKGVVFDKTMSKVTYIR